MSKERKRYTREFTREAVQMWQSSGKRAAESAELRQLRKELALVKQERDILKKSSASSRVKANEIRLYPRP